MHGVLSHKNNKICCGEKIGVPPMERNKKCSESREICSKHSDGVMGGNKNSRFNRVNRVNFHIMKILSKPMLNDDFLPRVI